MCNRAPVVTLKIYALPELLPPASSSDDALTIARSPDIATELLKKSLALVPYAFGLSSVCTRAPEVTLNMYALPGLIGASASSSL